MLGSQTKTALPHGNAEGTRHFIVLSGGEPFTSRFYDGQGVVVHGCQPSTANPWPSLIFLEKINEVMQHETSEGHGKNDTNK